MRVYQLLFRYMEPKIGADLVFTTEGGEKVTHVAVELEKLGECFGKKFNITPTLNCKQIATSIGQTGTDADVRATASYLSHSLNVHQSSYQQKSNTEETMKRYNKYFFYQLCKRLIHPVESDGPGPSGTSEDQRRYTIPLSI